MRFSFDQIARLPERADNVAITNRRLEAGTEIEFEDRTFRLPHTILEGHRFAVVPIATGEPLLSWGLPFGTARRDIAPGDYVCNAKILEALGQRHVDFELPAHPNLKDRLVRYQFDEARFKPGQQVPRCAEPRCFQGFARGDGRGVGTRNFIVILGTTSLTSSYARMLAERFQEVPSRYPNIDGVVAIAHTEGGGAARPNNFDLLLRTLAGFLVNPNVAAALAVDLGTEPVTNALLKDYLAGNAYPIGDLPHHFLSVRGNYQAALAEGESIVKAWLDRVNQCQRSPQSLEHLKIGLQCGGSDAFSGVSGNPLVGWVSKELVRYGGAANLAETDELIGAEEYILKNVRDLATARQFLEKLERFQERVEWHGHTAEGNPSGGNNYRGLYNIAVKSIGAALKKAPDVCIDHVIDYATRMLAPGYYFMDSPGNDLESVAGQIAAGCNMILFTTGNGSITNFPYAPTIKIMTSTGRYRMLTREMDVNAGRIMDGTPMDELGRETFELMVRIASGEKSAGEKAGQSQVQIWREWRQTDRSRLARLRQTPVPAGEPLKLAASDGGSGAQSLFEKSVLGRTGYQPVPSGDSPDGMARASAPNPDTRFALATSPIPVGESPTGAGESPAPPISKAGAQARFRAFHTERGWVSDQVGLIVPTSLCSGQIGRMIAEKLNRGAGNGGLRYVALAHTEGCGSSGGESEILAMRTMAGYLAHPLVKKGLLLEHGCEKTHNDAMRNFLAEQNLDPNRFGWASIQMDGGIESVTAKVMNWFRDSGAEESLGEIQDVGLESARIGLTSVGPISSSVAEAFARLARAVAAEGGTVVVAENSSLLASESFSRGLFGSTMIQATLAYGQRFQKSGFHIMETPTDHYVETLTGLGATGIEVIVTHVVDQLPQSHPMVPVLHIGTAGSLKAGILPPDELDLLLEDDAAKCDRMTSRILELLTRVLSREYRPKLFTCGNTDFQMTRGLLGVSL